MWKDPFSLKAATARQGRYAAAYKERGKWTPQFRVENKSLRGKGLGKQIQDAMRAAAEAKPQVELKAVPTWTPPTDDAPASVAVVVTLTPLQPANGPAVTRKLLPLLVQKRAVTDVPVGENKGKTLKDFFIVRVLGEPVDPAKAMAEGGTTITLQVPKGLQRENLHVAVLLEEPATMRTVESTIAEIPAPKK